MKKLTDIFLALVIPLCLVYMAILLFWTYFLGGSAKGGFLDVIVICIITVLMMFSIYGFLALVRDLKEFGTFETVKYWWNKLIK